MTNEVTTTGSNLPAHLQAHLQVNKPSADLASLATAQNSTPRLSLRAKRFRFMDGTNEDYVSKLGEPVHVHIVGVEPGPGLFTKTFYAKAYAGGDSAGEPPDCSSADGIRPDPWIGQPVHTDCKSCPKNQFGSALSRKGRPSKACHDSKRMMITREGDPEGVVRGKLYLSQVPVSSLRNLADYGKKLQDMGVEPWMVRTKLSMDEDSEFPELKFDVDGFVSAEDMTPMSERSKKREWAVSRNAMLQHQPQRPALPAHLQAALGGGAAAAAAPTTSLAPAAVDPGTVAAAEQVVQQQQAGPGTNPAPSNNEVLGKW